MKVPFGRSDDAVLIHPAGAQAHHMEQEAAGGFHPGHSDACTQRPGAHQGLVGGDAGGAAPRQFSQFQQAGEPTRTRAYAVPCDPRRQQGMVHASERAGLGGHAMERGAGAKVRHLQRLARQIGGVGIAHTPQGRQHAAHRENPFFRREQPGGGRRRRGHPGLEAGLVARQPDRPRLAQQYLHPFGQHPGEALRLGGGLAQRQHAGLAFRRILGRGEAP